MPPTFSAGPQALGYLYQSRVALDLLLSSTDETQLKIEALDDVEKYDPGAYKTLELTQLKHHLNKEAELTDFSPDLWRTIRVWAEQITSGKFALQDTKLYLLTTATAPPGSIASMLSAGSSRDPTKAQGLLDTVATTSENKGLTAAFAAYTGLTTAERSALVASIFILDQQDNIDAYKEKIKLKLRRSVRKQFLNALYERVEGWWIDQVITHLFVNTTHPSISGFELNEKVASLAEEFHQENLPIDFLEKEPDEKFTSTVDKKLFVQQLNCLDISTKSVRHAILDYYRAFQQRSRWLQEGLVTPDELEKFERTLISEWERYFEHTRRDYPEPATESQLIECGRKILKWAELEAVHLKIRPRVEAHFVRRGSFHLLADKEPKPAIHWHPQFVERLLNTLDKAANAS